nr:retrovirus-related Pol polyprotein from transposon 17.6 [Tanacetum cinerariifolium]
MNEVFRPFLRKFTLVFFDDILIYNPTEEIHVEHLRLILQTMREHKLFAKMSKCTFVVNKVEYLGHVISDKGLATYPSKVTDMKEWPQPQKLKQLRRFLRLTGYYRRFVKVESSQRRTTTGTRNFTTFQPRRVSSCGTLCNTRHKIGKKRNAAAVYVLVQWTNDSIDDATWELYDDITLRFLEFDLNV